MKKFSNIAYTLALAVAMVGCADYVDTTNYPTEKPEGFDDYAYLDAYQPLNEYVNRDAHPNFKLGVGVAGVNFNTGGAQAAIAGSNFDMATIYSEMMYGSITNEQGSANYEAAQKYAEIVEKNGRTGFGHSIISGTYQPVTWMRTILSNAIDALGEDQKIIDCNIDYATTANFPYSTIANYTPVVKDGTLVAEKANKFYLVENIATSPAFKYEFTITISSSKSVSIFFRFGDSSEKVTLETGWQTVAFTLPCEGDATALIFDPALQAKKIDINVQSVVMKHQRALTEAENLGAYSDEMEGWISGLMKANHGVVKCWDLLNETIADSGDDGSGHYPLRKAPEGSKDEFYWQDCFGDIQFAKSAYEFANKYYTQYGGEGTPTYYVNETCLDDVKKAESLIYWIKKWEGAGVKIDGIGTKMHVNCNADATAAAEVKDKITKNLETLAASGKDIMISELEVTYVDANGSVVASKDLTEAQQKEVVEFYTWIFKTYFDKVAKEKQAGITLWTIIDGTSAVGLWDENLNRKPIYGMFADALKGL